MVKYDPSTHKNAVTTSFYLILLSKPSNFAKTPHAHIHFLSPRHHALGLWEVQLAQSATPTRSEKTTQASLGQSAREIHKKHKHLCTLSAATSRRQGNSQKNCPRRSLRNFSVICRNCHRSAAMKVRWGTNREPRVVFERLWVLRRRRRCARRRQPRPRRRRSHRSLRCRRRRRRAFAGRTARGSPKCPSPTSRHVALLGGEPLVELESQQLSSFPLLRPSRTS